MATRTEKKKLKKLNAERAEAGEPIIVRTAKRHRAISISKGKAAGEASPKATGRFRDEKHPLDKAWLTKKISDEEYYTANVFRVLYEKLERSGVDMISALLAPSRSSGGGNFGVGWTPEQVDAQKHLSRIKGALPEWEFEILRKVCGEGWPMADAVHAHSICHEDGVLAMFRNALKHLTQAIAGARVSWKWTETAKQYRHVALQKAA